MTERVRFWDFASSLDGDYTAGVRMAMTHDRIFYIEDIIRGQWTPHDRDRVVMQAAQMDGHHVHIWLEQEPGSSGLSVVDAMVRMLVGYVVHPERVTGDKATRAQPFAAQCEAGNVRLVKGDWVRNFIEEICAFPHGKHDDQVDAAAGAFNKLALVARVGASAVMDRARPTAGVGIGRGYNPYGMGRR